MTPQQVDAERTAGRKIDRSVRPAELLPANDHAARICADLWRANPEAPLCNLANIAALCELYGFGDIDAITHKALWVIPEIARLQAEKIKKDREDRGKTDKPESYAEMRMRGVTFANG